MIDMLTGTGLDISNNDLQPLKAAGPKVTLGHIMETCCRPVHSAKALIPIWLTEEGIVTKVNEVHLLKASLPIMLTDGGIVRIEIDEHSLKVLSFIFVTEGGISI